MFLPSWNSWFKIIYNLLPEFNAVGPLKKQKAITYIDDTLL